MSWRELWLVKGKTKKFWKIKLSGKSLTEHSGRVGSAGEQQTTDFPTPEAAKEAYEKLIQKKQIAGWFDKPDPNDTKVNIFLAVEAGDLGEIRKCLRKDPEAVHARSGASADQPLHWAVRRGRREAARLLLDSGADINARGEEGHVPMLCAMREDDPDFEMLALLLEYHPDLTIADDCNVTPEHMVTHLSELGEFLQEQGVTLASDATRRLISTLEKKGLKEVEKQIRANPALARSPQIEELASVALGYGARSSSLIKLLLENGLAARWSGHGVSLLQDAIFRDSPDIVRALLEHGADPNGKGSQGQPLLIEAWGFGFKNRKAICDLLIQHGARKDLTTDLKLEGVKSVIAQIERDPNLLASVPEPVDLLNHAIEKGSLELVQLLLRHGVDPNAHGRTKAAPLRCAVGHGRFPIVQLLLEHGANPNPEDADTIEQGATLCYTAQFRALNFKDGAKFQDLLLSHGMKPMPGGT